ncbi:MAG: NYN domain-containing protein [Veillonellales bacterium]
MKRTNHFAVREGRLTVNGWKLKQSAIGKAAAELTDIDFSPDIQQKGVDMKIGLDIAWISLNKITERILVITGDSDFIPAIKLARRNGIQVYLFTLAHGVTHELTDQGSDPIY